MWVMMRYTSRKSSHQDERESQGGHDGMGTDEQRKHKGTVLLQIYKKLTVIPAFSPTNDVTDEVEDEFYNELQDTLKSLTSCNKHDMIVLMADLNAKVGEDNTRRDEVMERHGVGDMNDNGESLSTSMVLMV